MIKLKAKRAVGGGRLAGWWAAGWAGGRSGGRVGGRSGGRPCERMSGRERLGREKGKIRARRERLGREGKD